MSVLCALPVQVPVHRVRATVRCRELGTALHTTVRRLAEHAGDNDELIAAALGLPLRRVANVRAELAHDLALTEREYLMWVDHARGRCLPYSALDGVVVVRGNGEGLVLPVEPPTPASIAKMGLDAAASWDTGGVDGYVEIDAVLDVIADTRGGPPAGGRRLSHVLRLPDVQLIVNGDGEGDGDTAQLPRISLAQHGVENEELTRWLHAHYGAGLTGEIVDLRYIDATAGLPPWLSALNSERETIRGWEQLDPHPQALRELVIDAARTAQDQLALCAPDLRHLPAWLEDALREAVEREVPVVLLPAQAKHVPSQKQGAPLRFTAKQQLADQPGAFCVISDATRAVVHTDAAACLERGEERRPRRQHLLAARTRPAVEGLLGLLKLEAPRRRRPSEKLGLATVKRLLDEALAALGKDLPDGVEASIEPADVRFAAQTLDRYLRADEPPTKGMLTVTAGVAWERVLIATAASLAEAHDSLELLASRWIEPGSATDLDLIVRDRAKRIVWVLDAKNAAPSNQQQGAMLGQLRILSHSARIPTEGWRLMGVIVHRAGRLRRSPHQTEEPKVLRCNLDDLAPLLLAEALPDQRTTA